MDNKNTFIHIYKYIITTTPTTCTTNEPTQIALSPTCIFLAKYKCIAKLGEGSFGMIYKAEYNKEHDNVEK